MNRGGRLHVWMRSLCGAALGALLLALHRPADPSAAAGALDQQQATCAVRTAIGGGFLLGQTFTAGRTGLLDQLDLGIARLQPTGSVTIQIHPIEGGQLGSAVLSRAVLTDDLLPPAGQSQFVSVPISPPVPVVAETMYGYVMINPTPSSLSVCVGVLSGIDFYPRGTFLRSDNGGSTWTVGGSLGDLTFQTFVSPVVVQPSTPTPTPTPTVTGTVAGTATSTSTPTPTGAAGPVSTDVDRQDKKPRLTEEQRQNRQHTNRSNRDDVYTEGHVVEVHQDALPPYLVIANRDGLVTLRLLCNDQCPVVHVGDYVQADGEKQHEHLFDATEVSISPPDD